MDALDLLFLFSNLLLCAGYAVRDILWLRILSVLAGLCQLPYSWVWDDTQPFVWQSVYVAIHGVNLAQLLRERRVVPLGEEEERLRQIAFPQLSPRLFSRLLRAGRWATVPAGTVMIEAGTHLRHLALIFHGSVAVEVCGTRRAVLDDGQFVGEMSFITGGPTSADVRALTDVRQVTWAKAALETLGTHDPDLRRRFYDAVGKDMARKLTTRDEELPEVRYDSCPVDPPAGHGGGGEVSERPSPGAGEGP